MIEESDVLYKQILWFIVTKADCGPVGIVRALAKATNLAIRAAKPEQQQQALKLAKSEIEFNIEQAGGLVETMQDLIKEQAARIEMLEAHIAQEGRKGDHTVQ